MGSSCTKRIIALATSLLGVAALPGCARRFEPQSLSELRHSILEANRREIEVIAEPPPPLQLQRSRTEVSFEPDRLKELDAMAGPDSYMGVQAPLGPDLLGQKTHAVAITLQDTITRAVRNNLDVQSARLTPAISEAQILAAQAAFDWVFFGTGDANYTDRPQIVPVIRGIPVGSAVNKRQTFGFSTGVRRLLRTGGTFSVSQSLNVTNNQSKAIDLFPDPSRLTSLDITLDQPLLRGFGSDVNLAQVRLSENLERDAIQLLKAQLLDTVTGAERAYWALAQARQNLLVLQRLTSRGVETRNVLQGRLEFDVRPAEYSDAVARVETRRADVIRAANLVRQRSDELKLLINDPDMTIGSETLLEPIDAPIDATIELSLIDMVTTSLANRPEIHRALLAIDDASIRQTLADNAKLPLLDLQLRSTYSGLGATTGASYRQISDATFVDYIIGFTFEQPIGNRAAEAFSRQRQLERIQAVVQYRAAVQRVVLEVKTAMRNLATNYRLIEQTRASRLAAAENLRTLLVEEQNTRALTPDFLDLKLSRQEALSNAELQEIQALTDYNDSLADLYDAMGVSLERNNILFDVPDIGDWGQSLIRRDEPTHADQSD